MKTTTIKMVSVATVGNKAAQSIHGNVLKMTSIARQSAQRVADVAAQERIAYLIADALSGR